MTCLVSLICLSSVGMTSVSDMSPDPTFPLNAAFISYFVENILALVKAFFLGAWARILHKSHFSSILSSIPRWPKYATRCHGTPWSTPPLSAKIAETHWLDISGVSGMSAACNMSCVWGTSSVSDMSGVQQCM